jgi:hypothetical protein
MFLCLLLVYFKQVYSVCFDLYLYHHQANSIKHELSFLNLVTLIMQIFLIVVIISECTLKNVHNI